MATEARVLECVQAHYEVEEVELGWVYQWVPESILFECECGETVSLTSSETNCEGCGAKHARLVEENLPERCLEGDQEVHPWRYTAKGRNEPSLPY